MRSLPKISFVIQDFRVPSPGQQLLDRFLIGYNRDGDFHSPHCEVTLFAGAQEREAVTSRTKDFGLRVASTIGDAAGNSDSIVVVGRSELVRAAVERLPEGARGFVYGTVADGAAAAREILKIAEQRRITLRAGTAVAGAFQLPLIKAPARIRKALAVTYGSFPDAELEAIEALWSFEKPGDAAPKVELLNGDHVWTTPYSAEWRDLFAAAFSRSNTIQGDPERDGRTQDVVGLRLVEKLVPEPRAWLLQTPSGIRTALFVMNGALKDLNIAFEGADGKVVSSQLYRPPAPMQDHFSELAGQIEDFFRQDAAPKPPATMLLLPAVLESMRNLWQAKG
jgi:hypothetical protein